MSSKLRIVVTGLIAQYPLGGVTWDYLHYVLGLHDLGHDVFYVEDTGQWPYSPLTDSLTDDPSFNVGVLRDVMTRFGLGERWAYRFPRTGAWFGLSDADRREVVRTADLVLNVSGTLARPDEYRSAGRLAYIDTDPVFTQAKIARGQLDFRRAVDAHDVHFTFGETPSPLVPATGHEWRPTRQPVVLAEWVNDRPPSRGAFTTVMNWTSYNSVSLGELQLGQKDVEFRRFLDLPALVAPVRLELAVNAGRTRRTPRSLLEHRGWQLVDPGVVCRNLDDYRGYIQSSLGEWSVAKNGYVAGRCGWFSCRSACYLAAGRPVVLQDTGFSSVIAADRGLVAFSTPEEAAAGILDVVGDYQRHAVAAREVAGAYFDSRIVLASLVEAAFETMTAAARSTAGVG